MATPPPFELKLMIKRSMYKSARSEKRKEIIKQQVKALKRKVHP